MDDLDGIPRGTREPDPVVAFMNLLKELGLRIGKLERAAPQLSMSITGPVGGIRVDATGIQAIGTSGKTVTYIQTSDGAFVTLDVTERPVARFGPLLSAPGKYGGEIWDATNNVWVQLLVSGGVSWLGISGKPGWAASNTSIDGGYISGTVATASNSANAGTAAMANGSSRAFNNPVAGTSFVAVWVGNDANNLLGKNTSSRRYKENIRDYSVEAAAVLQLRSVIFDRKPSMLPAVTPEGGPAVGPVQRLRGAKDEYGLIAEEVHKYLPEIISWHDAGDGKGPQIDGIRYDLLGVALLDVVKDLQVQITNNSDDIAALKVAFRAMGGTL
ncbi:tail fiber domain-containing protein [Arthrobacter sp. GMC3]|uniref:tail fiber domain-containing protein n=1 Tax=Arthrobacter sp. GMC3 TaxID=2058894 RepID=UPI000CE3EE5A|nr:tail fiber domain-containing protein [Arthrobacter sp. GMC3]